MTSAPYEEPISRGAEPGAGTRAQDAADTDDTENRVRTQPEGYAEEVDPAVGPLGAAAGRNTGDLKDPGGR